MMSDFSRIYRKYRKDTILPKGFEHDTDTTHAESAPTAPYTAYTGATLLKGKSLAAEIENYRRRGESLLHFFDLVAPQWWDRLYPFKDEMVRRPSKSADRLRHAENRLNVRLGRLTPRMIMPAAAAVASIEEMDVITVLPRNLIQCPHSIRGNGCISTSEKTENVREQLNLAFSIARRLGEIERLKQQIILHAMDWIESDGNDLHIRCQRCETLSKYVQPCLIEHHEGVQALITHYFRRRSIAPSDIHGRQRLKPALTEDPKLQLKYAFNAITAANLSTTNIVILNMLEQMDVEPRISKKDTEVHEEHHEQQQAHISEVEGFNTPLDTVFKDVSNPSHIFMSHWPRHQMYIDTESMEPKSAAAAFSLPTDWLSLGDGGLMGTDYEATGFEPAIPESDVAGDADGSEDLETIKRRLGSDFNFRETEVNRFFMKKRSVIPSVKSLSLRMESPIKGDYQLEYATGNHYANGSAVHSTETDKSNKTPRNFPSSRKTSKQIYSAKIEPHKSEKGVRMIAHPPNLGEGVDILTADFRKLLIEQKHLVKNNPFINSRQCLNSFTPRKFQSSIPRK